MVFFIHGLMGSPSNWNQVIQELSFNPHNYNSLKVDYLDKNVSDDIYIKKEIDKNSIHGKQHLGIGNSIGCKLLLESADKFEKLILVAPPHRFSQKSIFTTNKRMEELKQELFYDYSKIDIIEIDKAILFWKGKTRNRKVIKRLKEIKKDLLEFNFIENYQKYQDKIHFVLGSHDQITPPNEFILEAKEYYPRAKITVIQNVSHVLQMEKPKELSLIIKKEFGELYDS